MNDYERVQRQAFALLENGFRLGGGVSAARDELHERREPAKYEYQTEFARRYYYAQGKADLLTRQLTLRFGTLPAGAVAHVSTASIDELDAIGERLLTAPTLQEVLGPH